MKTREYNAISAIFKNLLKEEQRGFRFFSDAAKYCDDLHMKSLFEKLASAEVEHIDLLQAEMNRLQNMRDSLKEDHLLRTRTIEYADKEIPLIIIDPDDKSDIAVDAVTLFKVDEFKTLFEKLSMDGIYRLAMRIEFDNCKYLVEASHKMKSPDSRKILLKLAQEEKEHFLWIEAQRKKTKT